MRAQGAKNGHLGWRWGSVLAGLRVDDLECRAGLLTWLGKCWPSAQALLVVGAIKSVMLGGIRLPCLWDRDWRWRELTEG